MVSPENSNWDFDIPIIDDMAVTGGDFSDSGNGFYWSPGVINGSSNVSKRQSKPLIESDATTNGICVQINGSFADSDCAKESGSNKRVRADSSCQPSSKACREKLRRDKLNERFLELGSILEPGKTPKMDKVAILNDAIRMVTDLRSESQKLKDSNESLQEKIKELKSEKNELRDEKQRLKAEKEGLEQQVKILNARASLVAHPPVIPAAFAAQGQTAGHKLMMPVIGYPGFPMWQFMPSADVDTSQDAESHPPVA